MRTWQPANPPAEEAQQLERGAVGPMGVLADDDRRPRPRGEGRQHLPKEPVTRVALERELVDLQTECRSQVADRTERTRRGERVARRPQHRRRPGDPAAELVGERRLAHAGLAAHEHHPPVPRSGLAQMLLELLQVRVRARVAPSGRAPRLEP